MEENEKSKVICQFPSDLDPDKVINSHPSCFMEFWKPSQEQLSKEKASRSQTWGRHSQGGRTKKVCHSQGVRISRAVSPRGWGQSRAVTP